jgi:rubrerythrin
MVGKDNSRGRKMRDLKLIKRGEFPGEDKPVTERKCISCGYVTRHGIKCPMCGGQTERLK